MFFLIWPFGLPLYPDIFSTLLAPLLSSITSLRVLLTTGFFQPKNFGFTVVRGVPGLITLNVAGEKKEDWLLDFGGSRVVSNPKDEWERKGSNNGLPLSGE